MHAGLLLSDLPKLLPFFMRGGWPIEQDRQTGTVMASLRLSEPEEDSDVWLLETVLSTATTKKLLDTCYSQAITTNRRCVTDKVAGICA